MKLNKKIDHQLNERRAMMAKLLSARRSLGIESERCRSLRVQVQQGREAELKQQLVGLGIDLRLAEDTDKQNLEFEIKSLQSELVDLSEASGVAARDQSAEIRQRQIRVGHKIDVLAGEIKNLEASVLSPSLKIDLIHAQQWVGEQTYQAHKAGNLTRESLADLVCDLIFPSGEHVADELTEIWRNIESTLDQEQAA